MGEPAHTPWHGLLTLAAGSMLDQPADVLIDAAAEAGFDGVSLRLSGEHAPDDPARTRRRAADRQLTIHDAEVHRIAAGAPDAQPVIDLAAAVGTERLLVVSDLADRAATMAALAKLVERCDASGIRVVLEYMAWTHPSDPLDAIDIARSTGCRLLVDLLHHHRVGAGVDELDAIVESGLLEWVQLCDGPWAPPGGGEHEALLHEARHGRLPPGHGELPLNTLLARVPADMTMSVEVQSDALLAMRPRARATVLHDAARAVLAVTATRQPAAGP